MVDLMLNEAKITQSRSIGFITQKRLEQGCLPASEEISDGGQASSVGGQGAVFPIGGF